MSRPCVIGVDLGGTNVRAQAMYLDGTPAGDRFENPSNAQEGTERILDSLALTISQAANSANSAPLGVGLAIPGHVDDDAGLVRWAPNFGETINGVFQYWENVPINEPLSRKVGIPVSMGNDANLAALGEYKFGVGEGVARCLVMITLGTGIGGGVVMAPSAVQGKASTPLVLLGGNKGGAELGHTIIQTGGLDCNAGTYGSLEAYCQRDSIIRRAVHKLRRGRASVIKDWVDGDLSKVTPRLLSEAATQGDEVAREVYDEVGYYLGVGIGSFINIFAPDLVAIGGQISKAGEFLMASTRDAARSVAIPSLYSFCQIVPARHIDDAGILGGAALAFEMFGAK